MPRSTAIAPAVRASLVLAGLAWTLPFLLPYHSNPLTSFYSEWLAFALGLGAVTMLLWPRAWPTLQMPMVGLAPLGLIALILLQWLLGRVTYTEQALTAALYLLWALAMMVLGSALRREIGVAGVSVTLAWSLLAGGLLSAVAALLQCYQLHTFLDSFVAQTSSGGMRGNLGQTNHFADFIALTLASLAYLAAAGKLHRVPAVVVALLLLFVLALTGSRSAWLYLPALAVLALWFARRSGGPDSQRLVITTLLLLAGFVLMQWLARLPAMAPSLEVITSGRRLYESAGSDSIRLTLWREAWSVFLESPLLGAGFGQFAWQHFQLGAATGAAGAPGLFNHAHNIVLQSLAETGFTGASIVLAAVVVWLTGLKRLQIDLHLWWLVALTAVMGIHSLLEYPLWYAYFLGIAALLLGVGATRFLALDGRGISRTGIAAAVALGWFITVTTMESYRELERILFTAYRDESAIPAKQEFTDALMRIHGESLFTPYVEFAMTFAIVPDRNNLKDKLELNARAMHFSPADTVVYRHALLLALNGERAAALEQLQRAVAQYPHALDSFTRMLEAITSRFPGTFEPLLEFAHTRAGPGAEH